MTPHGPIDFSFRDPPGPLWAMLALAIALTLAGGIVGLLFAVEGTPRTSAEDTLAVAILVVPLVLGGPVATAWGIYALVRRAEWHVTATHVYRTRGPRVLKAFELRVMKPPILTGVVRYGQLIGVRVMFGRPAWNDIVAPGLVVPSMDVAHAIADAWRARARAR